MIFHLCLWTNKHMASTWLAGHSSQCAVVPWRKIVLWILILYNLIEVKETPWKSTEVHVTQKQEQKGETLNTKMKFHRVIFTVCSNTFILFWLTKTSARNMSIKFPSTVLVYLCLSSIDLFIFLGKSFPFLLLLLHLSKWHGVK